MSQLSKEDIDFLQQSLVQKEIKYDPLVNEILDHICCEVESLMETGMSFSDAYLRFSKSLQPKALKQLEDETIHLVNFKLFIMKKAIYILASITISLLLISSIFKFMHWPGGGTLFLFSLVSFTGFFPLWISSQYQKAKSSKVGRVFIPIAALFIFVFLSGSLFKVMYWPGANIMVVSGVIGSAVISVPFFFYNFYQQSLKS